MTQKKLQKVFYFSSESNKNFIESRIERIALKENRSTSYIIENILLKSLLPENEEARMLLQYKLQGEHAVRNTLEATFSHNASGYSMYSRYGNLKPLVDFAWMQCHNVCYPHESNVNLNHFHIQFEEIVERIVLFSNFCIDMEDRKYYKTFSKMAQKMLEEAQKDSRNINIKEHICLVRDCWLMLYDWSTTYRYLGDLVRMNEDGWNENAQSKEELYCIISDISKEWGEEYYAHKIRL